MYSKKRLYRHKRLQEWANEELGSALLSGPKSLPTETKEENKKTENQVVVEQKKEKKESKLDILKYRFAQDVWWNICKFLKWQDRIRLKHACTLHVDHPNLVEIQKIACPGKYTERQLATACMLEWLAPKVPFSMDNRLDTSQVKLPLQTRAPRMGQWPTRDINYAIVVDAHEFKTVTREQLDDYRITYGHNTLLAFVTTSSVMKLAVTSFYTHKWDTINRRVSVHLFDCLNNEHQTYKKRDP